MRVWNGYFNYRRLEKVCHLHSSGTVEIANSTTRSHCGTIDKQIKRLFIFVASELGFIFPTSNVRSQDVFDCMHEQKTL